MMKIICIKGGLGNQLFEYSFARYQERKEGQQNIQFYYDRRKLKEHGGVQIDQAFDLPVPTQKVWIVLLTLGIKLLRAMRLCRHLYDERDEHCLLIDDYCQEGRFVDDEEISKWQPRKLSQAGEKIAREINESIFPVSIHVRRGDYLHPDNQKSFGSCGEEYYKKAVDTILKEHPQARFFLFSDDKEWLAQNSFAWLDALPVTDTDGQCTDLLLMNLCKGHIIANSTYSYWGARLSKNGQMTIYPAKWYVAPTWQAPDIFPDKWIKL